ncbi:hypothetical protein L1987_63885 [Smallanthus sonchifolius]|uniref:Uncharacterized protein n=1 Tax=Smallanthus sonchifolius TaxID=185202 RepID=A0ACB9CES3_9ASTR|nr:hypothetical protein L1987_63885 [Smallanthus sonchifolius]
MQHTRSKGSPDFEAYSEPERKLHERSRKFRECLCTVHQRACDGFTGARSSITRPAVTNARNWRIPSHVMNTISNSTQLHGLEDEDAQGHLSRFMRVCDTFRIYGATDDAILLCLSRSLSLVALPLAWIPCPRIPLPRGRI